MATEVARIPLNVETTRSMTRQLSFVSLGLRVAAVAHALAHESGLARAARCGSELFGAVRALAFVVVPAALCFQAGENPD